MELTQEQESQIQKVVDLLGNYYATLGNPIPDVFPKDDEVLDGWIIFTNINRVSPVKCNTKMTWGEGFTSRVPTNIYSTKLKALAALLKAKEILRDKELIEIKNQITEESKVFLKDLC